MRFVLALAAVLFVWGAAIYAADPDPAPDQDAPVALSKVLMIDEFAGEIKEVAKLPDDIRQVAIDLTAGLEGTSFQYEKGTLKIGYDEPTLVPGVQLAIIVPKSDCPNNTQFNVTSLVAGADKRIDAAVLTWTRQRHGAPDAPLHVLNKGQPAANLARNFDVQLKLNRVASLSR